jgi:hypothetical protein
MADERTDISQVQEARRIVERMRDRLLHPSFEALEDSGSDLSLAVECIRRLDANSAVWQGAQRKALEAEVTGLRRGVHCVEALLSNAGKFYAGWARLLSPDPAPPNYTSSGVAGLASAQSSKLVIHG